MGGPAMNDSQAAVEFLNELNVPLRSMVSLDIQTIESWNSSKLGLNPVQTAMQIAIPEIDGATEPFIYGGIPQAAFKPEAIEDRCQRIARRLARWNRLQTLTRSEVKLALVLFCFPPNKGNIGTAAELDVFPSLIQILKRLEQEGYSVEVPSDADSLRHMMLGGQGPGVRGQGSGDSGQRSVVIRQWPEGSTAAFCPTAVAYRMGTPEYTKLCPYVREIEREWGPAPGRLNSDGHSILIQGIQLGNVFIGVQPTFGYEGDPGEGNRTGGGATQAGRRAIANRGVLCSADLFQQRAHVEVDAPGRDLPFRRIKLINRTTGHLNVSVCRRKPGKWTLVFRLKTPFHDDNVWPENHILRNVAIARESGDEWQDELLANGRCPFHQGARYLNDHVFGVEGHDAIHVRTLPHAEILIDKRSDVNRGPDG